MMIGPPQISTRRDWLLLLGLIAVAFGLYFQTHRFSFIDYDDPKYIFENPRVVHGLTFDNVRWAMTATVHSNWHPLTILCWLALSSLFGIHAGPFHLFNAGLHAINVGLLFLFLRNATGRTWTAAFAASLWGLHPLRVESVAWVSELKDVLCGMFWLLCMLAYLRYARHRTIWNFTLIALLHLLALLSKPMAVTLPATLLLLDYWPLRDKSQPDLKWWVIRIVEKLPLVVLSVGVAFHTIKIQQTVGLSAAPVSLFPFKVRIENAFVSIAAYLRDTFIPRHLGLFYPHPAMIFGMSVSMTNAAIGAIVVVIVSISVFTLAKKRPYLPVGWLWFLITLLPVIGLVQVGEQARADRYTYVPAIGLTVAITWLIGELTRFRPTVQSTAVFFGVTAVIALCVVTFGDIAYWQDTQMLFTRADAVIPNNYVAKMTLAATLLGSNRTDEVLRLTAEAISISPTDPAVLCLRGQALISAGKYDQALAVMVTAKNYNKLYAPTWKVLGQLRAAQARQSLLNHQSDEMQLRAQAIRNLQNAVFLDPDSLDSWDLMADQTARMGKLPDAISIWQDLVKRSPEYAIAHGHLADALRITGSRREAAQQYALAIQGGATDPSWEENLAYIQGTNPGTSPDEIPSLIAIAKNACDQSNRQDPGALDALAVCMARAGRFDDAVNTAQEAIDQANRLRQSALAKEIRNRLSLYQRGLCYLAGDK